MPSSTLVIPSEARNLHFCAGAGAVPAHPSALLRFSLDTCYSGIPSVSDTQTVISRITLPNGQQYQFHYGTDNSNPAFQNHYGLLNEIDYPSGGWVKYTWKLSDNLNEFADYPGAEPYTCNGSYCATPVPDGCLYRYATPVVASRQVGFGGSSSPSLTQTFTYNTTWGTAGTPAGTAWTQKTTSLVTTDNVRGKSYTTNYTYLPFSVSRNDPFDFSTFTPQVPLASTIQYYDFNSALLRTVNKTWFNQFQLAREQTVLETGQSSLAGC